MHQSDLLTGKRNFILSLVYVLFLIDVALQFYTQTQDINLKEGWNITEWLINYRGGFVRRGLPGEIILRLYNYFGLSPYSLIMCICAAAYVAVVAFFIYSFRKKGYSLFLLPFVFFLGNPVINNFWVRKDLLLVLSFIAIIYFLQKKGPLFLALSNSLFVIALLMHEAIGFFCFPVMFLLLINNRENGKALINSIGISILKLSPSIITFICVLYNKGTWNTATMIWNSWKNVPFPYSTNNVSVLPAAIDSLTWSLHRGLSLFKFDLTDFYEGIYAPVVWALIIVAIYFILSNANRLNVSILQYRAKNNFNKSNISAVLIFQFITVIPLFILGCDFGRWIFFWIASSFAIYLLVPEEKLQVLFPASLLKFSLKFNRLLERGLPASRGFIYLLILLLGFPPLAGGPTWKIGVDGFYKSAPLIIVLKLLSILVKKTLSIPL
jgi:hypothetical protein